MKAVSSSPRRPALPAVVEALAAQNARYGSSPAREAHLDALENGAPVVVTGQQVGLFLGPLYTIYKAATAIRHARLLASRRGAPVAPVFWLQTEDHDLAEIAHCQVAPTRGISRRLEVGVPAERISVAHRVLPEEVVSRLAELHGALAHLPHVEEHHARLRRHYRPGAGWAEAFAGTLAELFEDEGLLLLDPREGAFARLAAPVHRKAILEARPIAAALTRRADELRAEGLPVPVHVREGSPLSFFHPDGPEGRRCRIVASADGFAEVGATGVHAESDLLAALEDRPMCFSTSALLRPILQDTLLPTAAYVAGPAEAHYYRQLPPLYEAFGMEMPAVVPRVKLRLLEQKTRRVLGHLGLEAKEVQGSEDEMLVKIAERAGDDRVDGLVRTLMAGFGRALDGELPRLRAVGADIDRSIEKTRGTVERAVTKLAEQYAKAERLRDSDRAREVRALIDWLVPSGEPQERVYGISYFAAQHGERTFLERVLEAAGRFPAEPIDLEL